MWADAAAWQTHLLAGACRLTGTTVGIYSELRACDNGKRVEVCDSMELGWRDPAARAHYLRMKHDHPDFARFLPRCTNLVANARAGQSVALLRPEMRSDREWNHSVIFNEYWRPASIDEFILALGVNHQTGSRILMSMNQDVSDQAPTQRAKQIMAMLVGEIAPLVGTTLATRSQRGVHHLSPRLRQTLEGLLAGEAEKQIALRLGISRATLHEYVGQLYRRFGVDGRAELMSYFVHRHPA